MAAWSAAFQDQRSLPGTETSQARLVLCQVHFGSTWFEINWFQPKWLRVKTWIEDSICYRILPLGTYLIGGGSSYDRLSWILSICVRHFIWFFLSFLCIYIRFLGFSFDLHWVVLLVSLGVLRLPWILIGLSLCFPLDSRWIPLECYWFCFGDSFTFLKIQLNPFGLSFDSLLIFGRFPWLVVEHFQLIFCWFSIDFQSLCLLSTIPRRWLDRICCFPWGGDLISVCFSVFIFGRRPSQLHVKLRHTQCL